MMKRLEQRRERRSDRVLEPAIVTCTSHRGLWLEFVDVDPVTCE